jgi:superfamily II DNA helicase RecQ
MQLLLVNLNFILRKEQMQALYEYTSGRNVVNLQTGYGKSICYCLCPLICDSLRGVTSKEH